jgi:hypothetical protein
MTADTPFCLVNKTSGADSLMCRGTTQAEALQTFAAAGSMCQAAPGYNGPYTCSTAFAGDYKKTTSQITPMTIGATSVGMEPVLAESTQYCLLTGPTATTKPITMHPQGKNSTYTCGTTDKPGTTMYSGLDTTAQFCSVPWVKPAK